MRIDWASAGAFLVLPVAAALAAGLQPRVPAAGRVEAGRRVYVAEGCIHCHSQYVRPAADAAAGWGEPGDPAFPRRQQPVLIGNRRQGPDLMNVGLRRPREWQRRHLEDPRAVVPGSRMPAYDHLFDPGDPRGEALLDYLDSLGTEPPGAPATAGENRELPAGTS